jgi:probable addiction module antidote protein
MKQYEFAKGVDTAEDMRDYIRIQIEENGVQGLIDALSVLAGKRGFSEVARQAGINRQSLYRSLAKTGNPKIKTIEKVANAVGLRLTVE